MKASNTNSNHNHKSVATEQVVKNKLVIQWSAINYLIDRSNLYPRAEATFQMKCADPPEKRGAEFPHEGLGVMGGDG